MTKLSTVLVAVISLPALYNICEWLTRPISVVPSPNTNVGIYRGIQSQDEEETGVVILSCLTPSAPNIRMIEMVYASLSMLEGLSQTAPVIIAIDNLVEKGSWWDTKKGYFANTVENTELLTSYVEKLILRFKDDERVTILPFATWQMHSQAIKGALEILNTKFVYILQHDEYLIKPVDHMATVKTMEEYPDVLKKVVFNRDHNTMACDHYWFRGECSCKEDAVSNVNGVKFTKTTGWTDVCHLTTKEYYDEVFETIGDEKTHPEFPMNGHYTKNNCTYWGDHFYGNVTDGPFAHHLGGRFMSNSTLADIKA